LSIDFLGFAASSGIEFDTTGLFYTGFDSSKKTVVRSTSLPFSLQNGEAGFLFSLSASAGDWAFIRFKLLSLSVGGFDRNVLLLL
jgi:hypothetical protein